MKMDDAAQVTYFLLRIVGRLHPLWRDGGSVLAVSRAEWRLTGSEPGHARCPVLFRFPIHGCAGRRRLEPRRAVPTETRECGESGIGHAKLFEMRWSPTFLYHGRYAQR